MDTWSAARRVALWNRVAGTESKFVHWIAPGVPMYLYGDSELSRLIYCRGFEWAERQLTARLLRPGDVYVDVGANIGLYTLVAADRVGESGRVYSFEPVSRIFDRLLENIELNGLRKVTPHQFALSDSIGEAQISVGGSGFDAWSSLGCPYMGGVDGTLPVRLRTWDDFAEEHDLVGRVTMMKIDVEGWESRVLSGGTSVFSRDDAPVLLVEFTEKAAMAAGSSCQELYRMLQSFGYELFSVPDSAGPLARFVPVEEWPNVNLLAAKKREWLERRFTASPDGSRR